ncbi:MAG: DNA repair protein RecO [Bacilli bacterium]|nr:DNA repair protein RecO [Bacilli bacterium]
MIEKVEGIIINEKDYGESSKIIDILTKEHGLLSVMAKGAKKLKNSLGGVTTKLTYGNFNIYYKEDKLSILISVDIIDSLRLIKKDLLKISYATFVCELVGQVIKQTVKKCHPKEIYDLFIASILKINEEFDPLIITNILQLKLLDYLGVSPLIDSCALCGNSTSIITLDADKGGFLCINCRTNEYIVSDKTIKMLRMFYYVDISKISKLDMSDIVKKEINQFINEYYDKHTGLYLKTKKFLYDIISSVKKEVPHE